MSQDVLAVQFNSLILRISLVFESVCVCFIPLVLAVVMCIANCKKDDDNWLKKGSQLLSCILFWSI